MSKENETSSEERFEDAQEEFMELLAKGAEVKQALARLTIRAEALELEAEKVQSAAHVFCEGLTQDLLPELKVLLQGDEAKIRLVTKAIEDFDNNGTFTYDIPNFAGTVGWVASICDEVCEALCRVKPFISESSDG